MTDTGTNQGGLLRATPSVAAARICVFCGAMGLALYLSTAFGADHVFYNAFGVDRDPHALRNAAVIFIATAWTNLVSLMNPENSALDHSKWVVNGIVVSHYAAETFIWHRLNWLTTLFAMTFLGALVTAGSTRGGHDA